MPPKSTHSKHRKASNYKRNSVRGSPEIPETHVEGASPVASSSTPLAAASASVASSVGDLGAAPSFGCGNDQPTASDIFDSIGAALVARHNHAVAIRGKRSVALCGELRLLTEEEEEQHQRKFDAYLSHHQQQSTFLDNADQTTRFYFACVEFYNVIDKLAGCPSYKRQRLQRSYDEWKAKVDDLELATGLAIPSVNDPILNEPRNNLAMTKVKDCLLSLRYALLAYKFNETKVYSGHIGTAMTVQLKESMRKQMKTITKNLKAYNEAAAACQAFYVFRHATYNVIKNVDGDFWADGMALGGDSRTYKDMQAFLLYQRAKEEVAMLKDEATTLIAAGRSLITKLW
ncbi:hypothetical protein [Absidia glauca]|uniref:Uncharacterized protein n=1 Tax=Absidia glauca TaxID=4829 RepID=A0A163LQ89_ABSGL|nr:hypothetical protein [Absidia glauca]